METKISGNEIRRGIVKHTIILAFGLVLLLTAATSFSADVSYKTQEEKISYGIGYDLGQRLKQQFGDIKPEALFKGLQDSFDGAAPVVTQEELAREMAIWRQTQGLKAKAMGEIFLAQNKKRKEITVTESGLQYEVITKGTGKTPVASESVEVHYRGTLIDGTEFDSSYSRGDTAVFPVSGVIKGMSEALQLMKEGSKWKLYVPSDIAYGERGAGGAIGPNSTLIFELELIGIQPGTPPAQ